MGGKRVEYRKENQFSETIEALRCYAIFELQQPLDVLSFFDEPSTEPEIEVPPDEPPISADGKTRVTKAHRQYISWRYACEKHCERTDALRSNKCKLFAMALWKLCSPFVKRTLQATPGFEQARKEHDCQWLITTLRNYASLNQKPFTL